MIEIKDLLIKFNKIIDKEEFKILLIKESIYEIIGVDLPLKDIKFKNNILSLNIKPIYKNEILINKDILLKKIKEKSNIKNIENFF